MLKQSQGVHLVFDRSALPATSALMIPKTRDGRVLFAIPWHQKIVVGTTDTPVSKASLEPIAQETEVAFILETLNAVLHTPVCAKDIRSVFAGLRPLVVPQKEVVSTKELSRDHKIIVSGSGLISIIGGKWTTYRKMAEETVNTAIKTAALPTKKCVTKELHIHGFTNTKSSETLTVYGSDAMDISKIAAERPELQQLLHEPFSATAAEVIWAVEKELARTVEDVLARRVRLLFLDADAALAAAPRVAQLLREALGKDAGWEKEQVAQFSAIAKYYTIDTTDTRTSFKPLPTN